MKYFSLKILILCILLPPLLYVFTVISLENSLGEKYLKEVEDIYIGDTLPLFDGSVKLKDAIHDNIDLYLQNKKLISWGLKVNVSVITKQGKTLYPAVFDKDETSFLPRDPMAIAADNYRLINDGVGVKVDVTLEHNTWLSYFIIAFYISVSVAALYFYYRFGINRAKQEDLEKSGEINRLIGLKDKYADNLKELGQERERLLSESEKIKQKLAKEKNRASKNEDEMIQDIVSLEEQIEANILFQEDQQNEIDLLKEKIQLHDKDKQKVGKQKTKALNAVNKRFKTLYKNIHITERAIEGFINLTDDMKIKCEEIIHQLNEDSSIVSIKRKVFGKKGRETVFEVIFAYKGRLYFHKTKDNMIEILAIGTKNTQARDLEFLNKI